MVTGLDAHLTQRALASLSAELTRRATILAAAWARDVGDYTERAGREPCRPPPAPLVIVIDEFASLARDLPGLAAAGDEDECALVRESLRRRRRVAGVVP